MDGREDALIAIRQKLRAGGVKVATLIKRCEGQDRNGDGLIHEDDLESVLRSLLLAPGDRDPRSEEKKMLSIRELRQLHNMLTNSRERGQVEYGRLSSLLEPALEKRGGAKEEERWRDDVGAETTSRRTGMSRSVSIRDDRSDYWATSRGSVGEFLANAAVPAEIKNFKRFIACMEQFERASGLKIEQLDSGDFVVPLGPDLRVTMTFSM